MVHFKICFIGIGSIARRHIRNIYKICKDQNIKVHIDALRRYNTFSDGIQNVYTDVDDVPSDYDAVFITNPTGLHLESLTKKKKKTKFFFIEKPLVSLQQIARAYEYTDKFNSISYIACPLRYHPVIQFIKKNIEVNEVISVRAISSSYLPEWRPDQDYRMSYSANKEMGGGVGIDLIHEWDYLTFLFGFPRKINYMHGKKSVLEINSDDYAVYLAEFEDKIAEVHLDYFGRKTIRKLELITKEDTIIGDIVENKIDFLKQNKTLCFDETRDDWHIKEIMHFLDIFFKKTANDSSFTHALNVLNLSQGIINNY